MPQDAKPRFPPRRLAIAALAACFAMLAVAVYVAADMQARKMNFGPPNFGQQEFELVDQSGTRRSNGDFVGKPIALFFGYTYCPDVCPMTLTLLGGALDDAVEDASGGSELQIVFVTVDAERDTPEQLASYLGLFDMPVTGLSGSESQLAAARKAFGAYARRVEEDGVVLYDHSAAVLLYDAKGDFSGTIVFNEPEANVAGKLKRLLEGA